MWPQIHVSLCLLMISNLFLCFTAIRRIRDLNPAACNGECCYIVLKTSYGQLDYNQYLHIYMWLKI